MDRVCVTACMVLLGALLVFGIRQERINEDLKRQNALQKAQIEELSKKQRLTAQDVGFLEKLIIEGKD